MSKVRGFTATFGKLFDDMTTQEKIAYIEFVCRDAREYMIDNGIHDAEALDLVDYWIPRCIDFIKKECLK